MYHFHQPAQRLTDYIVQLSDQAPLKYLLVDAAESTGQPQIKKTSDCNRTLPKLQISVSVSLAHAYAFTKPQTRTKLGRNASFSAGLSSSDII